MAAMTNSQSVATQLEKVRKKLPLMFERDDVLFAQIKARGDTERSRDKSTGFDLRNSILRLGYQCLAVSQSRMGCNICSNVAPRIKPGKECRE